MWYLNFWLNKTEGIRHRYSSRCTGSSLSSWLSRQRQNPTLHSQCRNQTLSIHTELSPSCHPSLASFLFYGPFLVSRNTHCSTILQIYLQYRWEATSDDKTMKISQRWNHISQVGGEDSLFSGDGRTIDPPSTVCFGTQARPGRIVVTGSVYDSNKLYETDTAPTMAVCTFMYVPAIGDRAIYTPPAVRYLVP